MIMAYFCMLNQYSGPFEPNLPIYWLWMELFVERRLRKNLKQRGAFHEFAGDYRRVEFD